MVVKYFFLYRVVFPTANTPFLIALVLRWCSTTCEGTGKTEASSATPWKSRLLLVLVLVLVAAGTLMLVPTSVPLGVITGIPSASVVVLVAVAEVIPSVLLAFRSFLLSSLSFSRIALLPAAPPVPVPARPSSFFAFNINLSRCLGSTGAGGILGAAIIPSVLCESEAEDDDAAK